MSDPFSLAYLGLIEYKLAFDFIEVGVYFCPAFEKPLLKIGFNACNVRLTVRWVSG
jgi:hypothetical protein